MGRDAGDYFIRDRALLEARPAQVLTGSLRGPGLAPGTLLTDPAETRPGVYALSACTLDTATAIWQVTAVQLNSLTAPTAVQTDYAIAYDDGTVWADEDGRILTYDFA